MGGGALAFGSASDVNHLHRKSLAAHLCPTAARQANATCTGGGGGGGGSVAANVVQAQKLISSLRREVQTCVDEVCATSVYSHRALHSWRMPNRRNRLQFKAKPHVFNGMCSMAQVK